MCYTCFSVRIAECKLVPYLSQGKFLSNVMDFLVGVCEIQMLCILTRPNLNETNCIDNLDPSKFSLIRQFLHIIQNVAPTHTCF